MARITIKQQYNELAKYGESEKRKRMAAAVYFDPGPPALPG